MAENNPSGAPQDLSGQTEQFIENNSRNIVMAIGAVAVLILGVVGYGKLVTEPAEQEANQDAWRAEQYFMMDSVDLALNGDGFYPGLYDIIDEHAGTTSAARAHTNWAPSFAAKAIIAGAIEALQQRNFRTTYSLSLHKSTSATAKLNWAITAVPSSAFGQAAAAPKAPWVKTTSLPSLCTKAHWWTLSSATTVQPKDKLTALSRTTPTSNVKATAEGLAAAIAR